MDKKLDTGFREWLCSMANDWDQEVEEAVKSIGADEGKNRINRYPLVRSALSTSPLDIDQFAAAARQCWVLGGQFYAIRFNEFINHGGAAAAAIQSLIDGFPDDMDEAIKRIDDFVADAIELGHSTPSGGSDLAGAAMLASLILTALYPNRFVDYRRKRWRRLAKAFGYERLPIGKTHGAWLVWASQFAREIAETPTYQEYWPEDNALWTIAGICWDGPTPTKPRPDPIDNEDVMSFPEGAEKRRLHLVRERNQAVVSRAKKLGLERDPLLRCQVCGFSFVETYGEVGQGFIEAHHRTPVAELGSGGRTTVEDIALVCPNCHRMLHRRGLTLDKLRGKIAGGS
jgi:hypothetical protein